MTGHFRSRAAQWSRYAEPIDQFTAPASVGTLRRMINPRPSAWALIFVLVVGLLGSAGAGVTLAAQQCTGWTDQFHPPTEIRVLRKKGPNAGHVEVVPFWNYVGTVLAAEYTSSGPKGPVWLRMGAQAVKQYGWYYTMHWRGGKVTFYNEDGSVASVECFDVRDTTADQIYRPEKLVNDVWVPINVPSQAQLTAMAETWPNSLRKWVVKKKKSRFFLTGYKAGKKRPCGSDATGFKIKQKSLGDCIVKGLTYEETQREYYEPNVLIVDPRERDVLDDPDVNNLPTYFGDLGVLSPGASNKTAWRVYAGLADGFAAPISGTFDINPSNLTGQGMGDANGDGRQDLVMLASGKIRVAVANGSGYDALTSQDLPGGAPSQALLVGDFNGDLLADVGLLRSTPVVPLPEEPATLVVMRGNANGNFSAPVDWWRGALDLTAQQVATGDVNGDGKSDLVIADGTSGVTFSVAPSFASCLDAPFVWGTCANPGGTGLDVATAWLNKSGWQLSEVKWSMTDFNRDGRSDVVAVLKHGSAIDVVGAKAQVGGGFSDTAMMLGMNQAFGDVLAIGSDINPDGLGDLVLLKKNGANTTVQWLRASQPKGTAAVSYVATTGYDDSGLTWAPTSIRAY